MLFVTDEVGYRLAAASFAPRFHLAGASAGQVQILIDFEAVEAIHKLLLNLEFSQDIRFSITQLPKDI